MGTPRPRCWFHSIFGSSFTQRWVRLECEESRDGHAVLCSICLRHPKWGSFRFHLAPNGEPPHLRRSKSPRFDLLSIFTDTSSSVQSLHATKARSETSNAPITGNFNVSSSLALVTSNAKIDVTANLYNDKEIQGATDLMLHTTNG